MTNEEAKERLIKFQPFLNSDAWKECYQLAIDALDKQIPKKPLKFNDDGYYLCPRCGRYITEYIDNESKRYCYYCDQKLDWPMTNEEDNNDTEEPEQIVHCNVYGNAKLIKTILDYDIDGETPDIQEVVRCKDCIHFWQREVVEDFDGKCTVRGWEVDKEDFCNYGLRIDTDKKMEDMKQ